MRVVIVSDMPVYREALVGLVSSELGAEDVQVWDRVEDSFAGEFDLALIELPPSVDPAEWTITTSKVPAKTRILIVPERNIHLARVARSAGFHGLISRSTARPIWGAALKLVSAGGEYFPCFDEFPEERLKPAERIVGLTARQSEVLGELVLGRPNKEIARKLGLSVATVKLHVQAILMATGARNRTEVAIRFGSASPEA
jgi:DNA-binding NarL/FixJ family response regulator